MYVGLDAAYTFLMQMIPIFIFTYICWIVFKALQKPDLFRGIESNLQIINNFSLSRSKDQSIQEKNPKIEELETFMEKEEPFLDPSLTVFDLSNQMGWSSRELSLLINQDLGQHFFDFVNGYRIKKAQSYLENYDSSQYNISEILYKVGFNSKSSFNTAFKKHAKVTPSQFRKTHSA
jgi:AraC-like DNA-binding protein